jgi:pimeloyl-ACP methyl ester carboxylesterase
MATPSSTYVLLPGAGGDAWYWHRVVPLLEARGHEVVAVDLPAADETKGLRDYADVAVAAIGERSGVVLVAQSMGAFLVPLVCARADVAQVVLVAPMIPAPGDSPGTWGGPARQEQASRRSPRRRGATPTRRSTSSSCSSTTSPRTSYERRSRGPSPSRPTGRSPTLCRPTRGRTSPPG